MATKALFKPVGMLSAVKHSNHSYGFLLNLVVDGPGELLGQHAVKSKNLHVDSTIEIERVDI